MLRGGGACAVPLANTCLREMYWRLRCPGPIFIQHLIVGGTHPEQSEGSLSLIQKHEHHKFPNDFIFPNKVKDPS